MKLPDRPKPGDPLKAAWAGDVVSWLGALGLRFGRTLRAIRGPRGSVTLEIDTGLIPVPYKARSPGSIVSANASGTFTLYADIDSTTLTSTTRAAKNGPTAIPANSVVWLEELGSKVVVKGIWC